MTFGDLEKAQKAGESAFVLKRIASSSGEISADYRDDLNHAYYLMGCAFFDMCRFRDASSAFGRALLEWNEDLDALLALGNCWDKLRKPVLAEKCFFRGSVLARRRALRNKFLYNLGNALLDQNKKIEALAAYRRIHWPDKTLKSLICRNIKKVVKRRDFDDHE